MRNDYEVPFEYTVACSKFCDSHKALMEACDGHKFAEIPLLVKKLEADKERFLAAKEGQGYEPDLDFMLDQSFDGFKIAGGRLVGDEASAFAQAGKWINSYEKSGGSGANIYYELAMFVFSNIHVKAASKKLKEREGLRRTA